MAKIQKMLNLTLLRCHYLCPQTKEKQFSIFSSPICSEQQYSVAVPHWPKADAHALTSALIPPLPLKKAVLHHSPSSWILGNSVITPIALSSPGSGACCLLSSGVSFYWQAWGLPAHIFLKWLWRILFHVLCSLQTCKSIPYSCTISGGSRGCVRIHTTLTSPPLSQKIVREWGMLLRIVARCWWMLIYHLKHCGMSHLTLMS